MKLETLKINNKKVFNFKNSALAIFLVFALMASFWFGKVLKDHIYWQKTKDIYTAAVEEKTLDYTFLKPFRNWKVPVLENLDTKAAVSLAGDKIIFGKESEKILPIASLTKIMTAYIALKNYQLDDKIIITKEIVDTPEVKGYFRIGESLTAEELLYSMLIESSNDAAVAIAEIMGQNEFVSKMNQEAQRIGLQHTYYVDPVGLDPDFENDPYNYSTAYDIALLVKNILQESENDQKIAKLFEITREKEYRVSLANGNFHHKVYTTNKILGEFPDMIGAKTGQTPIAKECFMAILPQPKREGSIINVVLGSEDRFEAMKKIINWQNKAFIW